MFRAADMQWKKMLPLNEYDALVFYGDLSYKAAACFKGMVLVGKKGREFHIIHTFLRQSTRAVLVRWLYDLYEERGLQRCRKIRYLIEGLFSMDEFVNDFDAEGDTRGYYIPVRADKRPKGDKYDRIEATQSYFERRNVWFNIDERETPDQVELVDQYLAFEKGQRLDGGRPRRRRGGSFTAQQRDPDTAGHVPRRIQRFTKILTENETNYRHRAALQRHEGGPAGHGRGYRPMAPSGRLQKIGYHYVVYPDGSIHVGRDISEVGAHVKGHNATSIGICYIGGLDAAGKPKDTRTSEQRAAIFYLLQKLREEFPQARIRGHRDFRPTGTETALSNLSEYIGRMPLLQCGGWNTKTCKPCL